MNCKTTPVFVCLLGLALSASAQTTTTVPAALDDSPEHRAEIFGGYSYMNAESLAAEDNVHLNGWSAELNVIQNEWLSWAGNISGHYGSEDLLNADRRVHNFLVGPRIRTEQFRRVVPYAQGMLGFNRSTFETPLVTDSDLGFALSFGVGADISLNERWSVRAIQADWIGVGLGDDNINNARLSFGLVYKFGER